MLCLLPENNCSVSDAVSYVCFKLKLFSAVCSVQCQISTAAWNVLFYNRQKLISKRYFVLCQRKTSQQGMICPIIASNQDLTGEETSQKITWSKRCPRINNHLVWVVEKLFSRCFLVLACLLALLQYANSVHLPVPVSQSAMNSSDTILLLFFFLF